MYQDSIKQRKEQVLSRIFALTQSIRMTSARLADLTASLSEVTLLEEHHAILRAVCQTQSELHDAALSLKTHGHTYALMLDIESKLFATKGLMSSATQRYIDAGAAVRELMEAPGPWGQEHIQKVLDAFAESTAADTSVKEAARQYAFLSRSFPSVPSL